MSHSKDIESMALSSESRIIRVNDRTLSLDIAIYIYTIDMFILTATAIYTHIYLNYINTGIIYYHNICRKINGDEY